MRVESRKRPAGKEPQMKKGFLAVATVAALLAMALPAQAKVIDREHYTFSESDRFRQSAGSRSTRTSPRAATRALGSASTTSTPRSSGSTTTSTRIDGRTRPTAVSLTIWGNAVIRDVKATHVEGSIFQFTTVESGRPFNLADASGRVLLRDRGSIRETYLFDTRGDDVPGGIFLETALAAGVRAAPRLRPDRRGVLRGDHASAQLSSSLAYARQSVAPGSWSRAISSRIRGVMAIR